MRESVAIPKQQNLAISRARLRNWDLMHEEGATLSTMYNTHTAHTSYTLLLTGQPHYCTPPSHPSYSCTHSLYTPTQCWPLKGVMAEISVTYASERYRNYTFCESGKYILLVKEGQVIDSYYCIRTIVSDEDYPLQLQRDTSLSSHTMWGAREAQKAKVYPFKGSSCA